MVLFFVLDSDSNPARGSAEGGRFEVHGEQLTFWHERNLSGTVDETPRMENRSRAEAVEELCRFKIEAGSLKIYFPSGNRMDFRKVP
jgi:hypothetical protein